MIPADTTPVPANTRPAFRSSLIPDAAGLAGPRRPVGTISVMPRNGLGPSMIGHAVLLAVFVIGTVITNPPHRPPLKAPLIEMRFIAPKATVLHLPSKPRHITPLSRARHTKPTPAPLPDSIPVLPRAVIPVSRTAPPPPALQVKTALHAQSASFAAPRTKAKRSLSEKEMMAIRDTVRRCYVEDLSESVSRHYKAHMTVTIGPDGISHPPVAFTLSDLRRMAADPGFRDFAKRAAAALVDPGCAKLPLPGWMLGTPHQMRFDFEP